MKEYNPKDIEAKWQKIWEQNKSYEVKNKEDGKENKYVLIEFPYPSGSGLHLGHCRSYTAMDAYARKLRQQGYNVLFPFGTDAFGLEAERTAIREKRLPQEIVERNVSTFHKQIKMLGISFDWSRTINSCDPSYFKWTQWQFIQFFKKGLAEKKEVTVNFCPNCGVLANEEVEDGTCCQCHAETSQKAKSQWVLKMTEYGERLADDLLETNYMEHIKTSQLNWIGKSYGVEVDFEFVGGGKFSIFTTCIETIYGCTFVVIAPESKIVDELRPRIENWDEVEKYRKETAKKSDFDRTEMNKSKSGCILKGISAINPANGRHVAVCLGDFVLANYGTGVVMAVPSHDDRDYDFAKAYNLPIIQVIKLKDEDAELPFDKTKYTGNESRLINSEEFDGITVEEAKDKITEKLSKIGVAKKKVNFKMRDWVFSRQRYWGEPIPMVRCDKCGWNPVDDSELPITLPEVSNYEPTKDGESPLSLISDWVETTCPKCRDKAKRETDTMPGWAGSSWYFMRYCDAHSDNDFASFNALKDWLPIDIYNGGNEHTTRHLLYARFWNKFLFDIGLSPVNEPFKKRVSQGLILGSDGKKMSKSAGNGIDPRIVIDEYGSDALRLWMSFIGEYTASAVWSDDGLKACYRFLNRIWEIQRFVTEEKEETKELEYSINFAIKKVTNDIENLKFNTAISALMTLVNDIYKIGKINKNEYAKLILLVSPFAPHIANEIWVDINYQTKFEKAIWPTCDESKLVLDEIEIPIQVNGKLRGKITMSKNASEDEIKLTALKEVEAYITSEVKKIVYIPGRIFNIVI